MDQQEGSQSNFNNDGMVSERLIFPAGFYWGAATSAHQVEGGNVNDWSGWEKDNAERLAKEAEKRFGHLAGWLKVRDEAQSPQNYISGKACDHYNRYEEDFDIAKSLNHNAHRFSIEWSRIEPEEGRFDEKEIEHYKKVIMALRNRGIEPFVTLWHWTQPVWIGDIGGWSNKKAVEYFCRFVEKAVSSLGEEVKFWIVLNEPNIYTGFSYIRGSQPPGIESVSKGLRVYLNLVKAQKRAYEIIHKNRKEAQVGFANSFICFEVKNNFFLNKILKNIIDYFWNFWFFNKIEKYVDFIGCNYYTRSLIGVGKTKNDTAETTDLGWAIYPEGIYKILKRLAEYKKPIYITENGIADAEDVKRYGFIKDHLSWTNKAIQEGADVKGYFYWSLLDNFEFPETRGFWPRFGLVKFDSKTMQREIRESAKEYAKIIARSSL